VGTEGKRVFSHHFTLGANLVFFGVLLWQVGTNTLQSSRPWTPFVLVFLGCVLLLVDQMRHILLDHGGVFFDEHTLAMYTDKGTLSPMGRGCQITTLAGLALLFTGLALFFQLPKKFQRTLCR